MSQSIETFLMNKDIKVLNSGIYSYDDLNELNKKGGL